MTKPEVLLNPDECAMVLVDYRAGLAFGSSQWVGGRALARTALAFYDAREMIHP